MSHRIGAQHRGQRTGYVLNFDGIIDDGHRIMANINRMQHLLLDINQMGYEGCVNSSKAFEDPVAWFWNKLTGQRTSGGHHLAIIEKTKFFHDVGQARLASALQQMMATTTIAAMKAKQGLPDGGKAMVQAQITTVVTKQEIKGTT